MFESYTDRSVEMFVGQLQVVLGGNRRTVVDLSANDVYRERLSKFRFTSTGDVSAIDHPSGAIVTTQPGPSIAQL